MADNGSKQGTQVGSKTEHLNGKSPKRRKIDVGHDHPVASTPSSAVEETAREQCATTAGAEVQHLEGNSPKRRTIDVGHDHPVASTSSSAVEETARGQCATTAGAEVQHLKDSMSDSDCDSVGGSDSDSNWGDCSDNVDDSDNHLEGHTTRTMADNGSRQGTQEGGNTKQHLDGNSPKRRKIDVGHDHPVASTSSSAVEKTAREPCATTAGAEVQHLEGSHYRVGELLGIGGNARVYNCAENDKLVIKIVEIGPNQSRGIKKKVEQILNEIEWLKRLQHPRVVHYIHSYMTDTELCMVLEKMPGGSLRHCLDENGAFDEDCSRKYTIQMLEGMAYLHNATIIHRDLKGANILLDESGDIKLCDFGLAKLIAFSTMRLGGANTFVGTAHWMAPEVVRGERYGRKCDIWSLGCTLVEMLTSNPPWHHLEVFQVMFKIGQGCPPEYTPPTGLSEDARDFLELCFKIDPKERPSAADLMQHRFVIDGGESLVKAAKRGEVADVRRPFAGGVEVDWMDECGTTPLYWAAHEGHVTVVEELCRQGAQVDITMPDGATPLFIAAQNGHTDAVNALLQGGANIDLAKDDGATPLYVAAQKGHSNVVSTLLHNNALVNIAMKNGQTPLTQAADKGHAATVRVLLTAGASQLVRYAWPIPLVEAVQRKDLAVVYALMDLDEAFIKSGSEDFTPLQWASLAGKGEVVEHLLDHDEATRKQHKLGWSHLHQVAESGGVKATRILIQRGAAVDARDAELRTPLHIAAAKDRCEVAQVLVDSGADINILNKNKETPLHDCARSNAHYIANALIEKGAYVSFADSCSSLTHMCAKYDSVDVARLILETKVDKEEKREEDEETALHICAKRDHSAVAELLLKNGANVEARDVRSRTPLHICACSGNVSMAELLMKYDCNVNPLDHSNNTPLHLCQDDSIAVAQGLLNHGANDETRNTDGDTPLHVVNKLCQIKLTRVLVEIRDGWEGAATDGFDALHWASAADNVRVVKMLLNHPKTDISQTDSKGRNALDIAVYAKNVAAAKALVGLDDTWSTPEMIHFTPLHWCAVANNVNLLKHYLEDSTSNVNIKDSMGRTALHLAGVTNGSLSAALLLEAGASAEMQANDGDPPLFTAYHHNSRDVFSRLFSHRGDVTGSYGDTIVHIAARLDDWKTINGLLTKSYTMCRDLTKKENSKGDSPLHVAAAEDSVEAATALLQAGADTGARNADEKKPLDLVGEKWNMLFLLQEAETGTMSTGSLGEIHQRVADGDDTLTDSQLKYNIGESSADRLSLLHVAVIYSRLSMVKRILQIEAVNVNAQDNKGRSALHLSTRQSRLEIMKLLLESKSCVIDITDKLGRSPLHLAARANSASMIKCLLEAGASASLDADDYKTPVHIILECKIDTDEKNKENQESMSLLLKYLHNTIGEDKAAIVAASALSSLIIADNPAFKTDKIDHILSKVENERVLILPCYLSNQTKGLPKEVSERWSRYTVFMSLVEYYPPERLEAFLGSLTEETINSKNFLQQNALHFLAEKHLGDEGNDNGEKKSFYAN